MRGNGKAFQPGTREGIQPFQFSSSSARDRRKDPANPVTGHITIYETNNVPLPQQYRHRMHSTVNQLRQHADTARKIERACSWPPDLGSSRLKRPPESWKAPKSSGWEREAMEKRRKLQLRMSGPGPQSGVRRWTQTIGSFHTVSAEELIEDRPDDRSEADEANGVCGKVEVKTKK